jgi:hypothetical protein
VAIFTLREILTTRPTIDLGDVVLTDFRRDTSSTVSPTQIIIETIEGDEPGIIVRTASPLASNAAAQLFGFEFRVTADSAIIEGASASFDGGTSFSPTDGGGSIDLDIGQAGRLDDNIAISLFDDNSPGAGDVREASDTIADGPVNTFRFEYDLSVLPAGGATATFTTSTILFDLADDEPATLPDGFDGLQYIASHADLIAAFGANRAAGEAHYLGFGQSEGREVDTFGETQYLNNYGDLGAAFGTNVNLATQHFITNGVNEGRNDDAAQIDGLQYIASHDDLIQAFGAGAFAGQQHHAGFGQAEGRALDTFNETQYLANYADLQAAFGTDSLAATQHFIQFGFAEGRNDFLV